MGRIPKVEKERALQLHRAGKSCSVTALSQDLTSRDQYPGHHSEATLNGSASETSVSTGFLGKNSGVTEAPIANGTASETAFTKEKVASSSHVHASCSNWVNGEQRTNCANSATKPLHHLNVEVATQTAKSTQVICVFVQLSFHFFNTTLKFL